MGALHAASLSVHAIGQELAMAQGTQGKHGVEQVDWKLFNDCIDMWHLLGL